MKKSRFLFGRSHIALLATVVVLLTLPTSCKKDDDDMAQPKTIADVIVENSDYTILEAAVTKAGLLDAFKNPNLTVFAPNDAAFRAMGVTDASALAAYSKEQLVPVLQYHVLASTKTAAELPTGTNTSVATSLSRNGAAVPVYITKNGSTVYVNGATVTQADMQASNGVIHTINMVLIPPALGQLGNGSLVDVVSADTSLSLLGTAAVRVAGSNATLAAALTGSSPNTVFAPTNSAFRAAGLGSTTAIGAAPIATLTAILANHVVTGRYFSSDLSTTTLTAAGGGKLSVTVGSSGVTIKSNGISTAANVTRPNITATNGVIHKIDRVLVP